MKAGDLQTLQTYVEDKNPIQKCKMEYLRTVDGLKYKIDEVEAMLKSKDQITVSFYEENKKFLKEMQKYLNILTKVSEKLRVENLKNFDLMKRNLLTTYNRQAHRFNRLIPEEIKKRMRQSKLFSKIMVQETESHEKSIRDSQKSEDDIKFQQIVQSLSFYLDAQQPLQQPKNEQVQNPRRIFSNQYTAVEQQQVDENDSKSTQQMNMSQSHLRRKESLKEYTKEENVTQQQKKQRNAYQWFLWRQKVGGGLRCVCLFLTVVLMILLGIIYFILRKAYVYFGQQQL